jgi:hypothetical protein
MRASATRRPDASVVRMLNFSIMTIAEARFFHLGEQKPSVPPAARYEVAPGAKVIGDVRIGHDVSIWFNAVLRGDNQPNHLENGSNIQDGCVVHTDPGFPVRIGENATTATTQRFAAAPSGQTALSKLVQPSSTEHLSGHSAWWRQGHSSAKTCSYPTGRWLPMKRRPRRRSPRRRHRGLGGYCGQSDRGLSTQSR